MKIKKKPAGNATTTPPTPAKNDDLVKAKGTKKEPEKKDDDEDEDDDEDDEMEKAVDLQLDALEKGLKELETIGASVKSRKQALLEKAQKNEALSADEQRELMSEIGGSSASPGNGGGQLSKALEGDDDLVKAMDLSPALDGLATRVSEAVDTLNAKLSKSIDDRSAFDRALANGLVLMGKVLRETNGRIDELQKSLDEVLDSPARDPKAVETDKPLTKALERPLGGGSAAATQMPAFDRRKLVPILESMHRSQAAKGLGGTSSSGCNIKEELAKALTGGEVNPLILRDAAEFTKAIGN